MRKVIWTIVVLAVLWCGWWLVASALAQQAIENWLARQKAQGWQAEASAVAISGFPTTFAARLDGLTLADPATGVGFKTNAVDVSAPAYWPGDVTLRLPDTPLRFSVPGTDYLLSAPTGKASVEIHPGPALQLESLRAESGAWQLNTSAGNLLSAADLRALFVQDAAQPERYHLDIAATDFAPGDVLRTELAIPQDWPRRFEALVADLTVTFDIPINSATMEERSPQPREIKIDELNVVWGSFAARGSGGLLIDAAGIPEGTVKLAVENWRGMMAQAETSGAITEAERRQAEMFLNALANLAGGPDTLDLDFLFESGELFLGPILLGPAPALVLD